MRCGGVSGAFFPLCDHPPPKKTKKKRRGEGSLGGEGGGGGRQTQCRDKATKVIKVTTCFFLFFFSHPSLWRSRSIDRSISVDTNLEADAQDPTFSSGCMAGWRVGGGGVCVSLSRLAYLLDGSRYSVRLS